MPKRKPRRIKWSKNDDPLLWFINATAFQFTARLIDAHPVKSMLVFPMITNESFALELHIKCLLRLRRHKIRKVHDIRELFGKLSKADQRKIAKYLLGIVRQHPDYLQFVSFGVNFDVDSILLRASNMFTKSRYWSDLELPRADSHGYSSNAGVGSLSDAIAQLILELRPEWREKLRNFRLNFPKTGLLPT